MLSIIIPTLNEEKYLPILLKSIIGQSFKDYEIIVSDAGSTDKTLEVAREYNCKTTKGGLPAKGRNSGAKIASGDILFFLDADTSLPSGFLKNSLGEFNSRNLDIASFCLSFNSSKKTLRFLDIIYAKMVIFSEKIRPFAVIGTLIKRDLFEKINGYDESIRLSEDNDLSKRAVKYGVFGIIRSAKIFISDRRFVEDGLLKTIWKWILGDLYTFFIGPVKSNIFHYKFGHYDKAPKNKNKS